MFGSKNEARIRAVSVVLCFFIGLFAAPAIAQQTEIPDELDVVGGNSSNSLMFWLSYSEESGGVDQAVTLNTDANAYPNLNSFTFLRDTCGASGTDVVAASTNASRIVIYKGGRGAGQAICGGPGQSACPARPTGLSSSTEQVIAVATSGAAGSTPGVFTFRPGTGPDEACDQFGVQGGALAVGNSRIRAIADSEFVRADGNGLDEGDLLVLVGNPAMIVRVTPDDIAASTGTGTVAGTVFAHSLDFFASHHRRATPTGLTIVPGENRNVLVTLSTGVVVNFHHDGSGWTSNPNVPLDAGSFPNPRGIAAGTRDDVPYIVVSDQNRGRYIRAELAGTGAGLSLVAPFREIVSPVGAPEGVAINNESFSVSVTQDACFDVNPGDNESLEDTGCDILGAIQVHLSSYGEGQSPGDRITAGLRLVEDTRAGSPLGSLDIGEGFNLPASCRGFLLEDGNRYVVVLDMGLNFQVGAANFIKVTEQIATLLPGVGDCTEESTRIFHRAGDDPGELSDKTFYCSNPSRSIIETFSPVALCFDELDRERRLVYGEPPEETNLQAAIETRRDEVNNEIRRRIDSLKGIVDELRTIGGVGDDPGFAALGNQLNNYITGRTNPNSSWPQIRYQEASCNLDKAALAIYAAKEPLFRDRSDLTPDTTLYARALSETLGSAFYISETGALVQYRPPWPLCDPGDPLDPRPELPDVTCRAWPDPNSWCAD